MCLNSFQTNQVSITNGRKPVFVSRQKTGFRQHGVTEATRGSQYIKENRHETTQFTSRTGQGKVEYLYVIVDIFYIINNADNLSDQLCYTLNQTARISGYRRIKLHKNNHRSYHIIAKYAKLLRHFWIIRSLLQGITKLEFHTKNFIPTPFMVMTWYSIITKLLFEGHFKHTRKAFKIKAVIFVNLVHPQQESNRIHAPPPSNSRYVIYPRYNGSTSKTSGAILYN